MLYGPMLHPELLQALAAGGHGAKVLVADANYPHAVWVSPRATRVALNLAPGLLDVVPVLKVLQQTVPIEAVTLMGPAADQPPIEIPAHDDYRALLPDVPFSTVGRFDFYDLAKSDDTCVCIATGEQRLYANVLLTIGVRQPQE